MAQQNMVLIESAILIPDVHLNGRGGFGHGDLHGELAWPLRLAQDQARRDRMRPLPPTTRIDRLIELILRIYADAHRPQNRPVGFGGGDVHIAPYVEILRLDPPHRGGAVESL